MVFYFHFQYRWSVESRRYIVLTCYLRLWHTCSSDGGIRHLQANRLLLLLLCFFSSVVSWFEGPRLFSSFSSLRFCCVTSASSSHSGFGVSDSGVWKLQQAQPVVKESTIYRTRSKNLSYYVHTDIHRPIFGGGVCWGAGQILFSALVILKRLKVYNLHPLVVTQLERTNTYTGK